MVRLGRMPWKVKTLWCLTLASLAFLGSTPKVSAIVNLYATSVSAPDSLYPAILGSSTLLENLYAAYNTNGMLVIGGVLLAAGGLLAIMSFPDTTAFHSWLLELSQRLFLDTEEPPGIPASLLDLQAKLKQTKNSLKRANQRSKLRGASLAMSVKYPSIMNSFRPSKPYLNFDPTTSISSPQFDTSKPHLVLSTPTERPPATQPMLTSEPSLLETSNTHFPSLKKEPSTTVAPYKAETYKEAVIYDLTTNMPMDYRDPHMLLATNLGKTQESNPSAKKTSVTDMIRKQIRRKIQLLQTRGTRPRLPCLISLRHELPLPSIFSRNGSQTTRRAWSQRPLCSYRTRPIYKDRYSSQLWDKTQALNLRRHSKPLLLPMLGHFKPISCWSHD